MLLASRTVVAGAEGQKIASLQPQSESRVGSWGIVVLAAYCACRADQRPRDRVAGSASQLWENAREAGHD